MEWISVKDRLPEDCSEDNAGFAVELVYLILWPSGERGARAGTFYNGFFYDCNGGDDTPVYGMEYPDFTGCSDAETVFGVTHWMPLPPPPKEGE